MPLKIAVYERVSTDEAALRSEGSLETQRHRILGEVEARNRREPNWGKVVDHYRDDGYSAKDTNRPAYQRMMRDVRSGRVNLIFVADYFRLCRNMLDYLRLADELTKIGARLMSIRENFDTETAMGQSMIRSFINFAQTERELTAERVSINFHARAMRGLRNGGRVLFGYDRDADDLARLMVNETEAAEIREIFRVFIDEGTCAKAAAKLNHTGQLHKKKKYNIKPTEAGREAMKQVGKLVITEKKWTSNAVQYVLRNPAYAGLRDVNRKMKAKDPESVKSQQRYRQVAASWPAIVDKKTWEATQQALDFSLVRERERLSTKTIRFFPLSGTLRCAECGGSLMGASGHGTKSAHRYYVHRRVKGKEIGCSFDWIPADDLEKKVFDHLAIVLKRQGFLETIETNVSEIVMSRRKDLEMERQRVAEAIQKSDSDIQKAIDLQAKCNDPTVDDVFRDRIRALGDEKKAQKRRLDEIENFLADSIDPKEAKSVIKQNIEEFNRAWVKAKPTMRKRLLAGVFSVMTLDSSGLNLYYRLDGAEMDRIQREEKEKAPGVNSGASPYGRSANRFKQFIHPYLLSSPTLNGPWDQKVFLPRVDEFGRGRQIRTVDLLLPKQTR